MAQRTDDAAAVLVRLEELAAGLEVRTHDMVRLLTQLGQAGADLKELRADLGEMLRQPAGG